MSTIEFCAHDLPAWRAALTSFAIDTSLSDRAPVSGRVERFHSARGIGFSILESGPQRLASLSGQSEDMFWLLMMVDGAAAIDMGEGPLELAPGDMLYGKRGAEAVLEARTHFRMLNITIPAQMLTRSSLVPLPTRVLRLAADTGVNAVLGAFLSGIAASIARLDDEASFAVEGALVQLVINSLFDGTGIVPLGGLASGRAALLRRIWQSVEMRLGDSELSLADIAAEHRLSVRYVQQLFEENGRSFRAYLRERRLQRCCEDLSNPINANLSITEICFHRGFGDSASFSRAFRDAYDCTPTEYRRRALKEGAYRKERLRGLTFGAA